MYFKNAMTKESFTFHKPSKMTMWIFIAIAILVVLLGGWFVWHLMHKNSTQKFGFNFF